MISMITKKEMSDYLKFEGKCIPDFSLEENYVSNKIIELGYFEKFDKSALQSLANDFEKPVEDTVKLADSVIGLIYFSFLFKAYEGTEKEETMKKAVNLFRNKISKFFN